MNDQSSKIAELLLSIDAVSINPDKPFTYTSGLKSPVYSDMRLLISHPEERREVIRIWCDAINSLAEVDVIAGTATAGIPHAAWIADTLDKPMVYVRSKAKEHGKQNQIEGRVQAGQKALVIEDLISTGKSSIEAVGALREKGVTVTHISSIFNYTLAQSKKNFEQANVVLLSLTTFPAVVEVAMREVAMDKNQSEIVLDWLEDAEGWAERHNLS
jgi:orotate phosphoribosyltransferase